MINFTCFNYRYCDHFKLNDRIHFNTCIHKVEKATDYQQSGRWILTMSQNQSSETTRETFDAVILASGLYDSIHFPHFQGVENFKGQVLHSRDYKDWKGTTRFNSSIVHNNRSFLQYEYMYCLLPTIIRKCHDKQYIRFLLFMII